MPMDPRTEPASLLPLARGRYADALAQIAELVGIDSGSLDPDGVNRVADWCEARFRAGGWAVERRAPAPLEDGLVLGDMVIGRRVGGLPTAAGGRRLLLMAHMDTVYGRGTAAARPFRVEGGRAYGPGVIDDKSGLVVGIEAVETLCVGAGFQDFAEITMICTPDEEIGSLASRPVVQALARAHDVALGLEAARPGGEVVTARKGIHCFKVEVTGRAAHSGVHPQEGVNAVLEAAHKTVALQSLNGRWPDVTSNVGVVQGGSRPNVVAERAVLHAELRAATVRSFQEAQAAAEEIVARSFVPGTTARLIVSHQHVPMERTAATAELLRQAQEVASGLGFELGELASGGASEANITAAAGIPTLDGLGPVGGAPHSPAEWLDTGSLVPRISLLAGLLARLGSGR